ncbi:MAG TPA: EamA family transporter [Candidatus Acidoferrales bacterium]|nr:EamA family transporter [Candidatus Acidoferrales bacterium]
MANAESHTSRKLAIAFGAVYLFWGSTFLAIRYGVQTIPPLLMTGTRHLIAGPVLYAVARLRGAPKPQPKHWLSATCVGALLLLCGNGAVSATERVLPSGVAALLVATVSLWMIIVEWLRPGGHAPTFHVACCLALGFFGVVILVSPRMPFMHAGQATVNPVAAVTLVIGSLMWASGSILSRHIELPRSPLLGTAMFALTGGTLLWVVGLATGEGSDLDLHRITTRSYLAVAYLAVFGSIIGLSAYTYMLKNASASRVSTYAFVNPVIAVLLGWLVAGEKITSRMLVAAAIILVSVVLVIIAPHAAPEELGSRVAPD